MIKNPPKYIRGKYTPAQNKLTAKYIKEHYDDIKIRVRKGDKQRYSDFAKQHGLSLNKFCVNAMDAAMEEDKTENKVMIFKMCSDKSTTLFPTTA